MLRGNWLLAILNNIIDILAILCDNRSMKKTIKGASATEIKNRFGDYLGEVIHGNNPVLIEKHGKPVAVIISYKSWKEEKEGGDKIDPWINAHRDIMNRIMMRATGHPTEDAVTIINDIREEES